jgi:hypothetical protein
MNLSIKDLYDKILDFEGERLWIMLKSCGEENKV